MREGAANWDRPLSEWRVYPWWTLMPEEVPGRLYGPVAQMIDLADELYAMEEVARELVVLGITVNAWFVNAKRLNVLDEMEGQFLWSVLTGILNDLGAMKFRIKFER